MNRNKAKAMTDNIWNKIRETGLLGDHPVRMLDSTDSTNSVAMQMLGSGALAGTLVIAETQANGRGRLQRSWFSPPGTGLYLSMIMRPKLAPFDLPKIPLAAGVAVCRAIEEETGLQPGLKWPNDLLLDGRKFGGILCESEGAVTSGQIGVILGIGINVSTPLESFPSDLVSKMTSLTAHSGRFFQRGQILARIVPAIDKMITRLEQSDWTGILREWKARDAIKGKKMTWLTPEGEKVIGTSLGPDSEGVLYIKDDNGTTHRVLSGDVSLII
ncbi:MAG: biotin--[acetyl-CoA-carboxylase] ligase [Desulfobulbaceae bacterium]|nr:biotin--[acetyl-CoA-carboxylase] ligase [Desulfobulbaceae bacterium]MCK5545716.1 biotin--[acetyl-CoA-carboxylase] ligase [Desulfobulbaceae bacterium]